MKYKRGTEGVKTNKLKPRDKDGLSDDDIYRIQTFFDLGMSVARTAESLEIKPPSLRAWRNKPHIKKAIKKFIMETAELNRLKFQVVTDKTISIAMNELEALEKYTLDKNKYDNYYKKHKQIHNDVVACMKRRKGDIPDVYTPNYSRTIEMMNKIYGKATSLNINIDNKEGKSPVVIVPQKTEADGIKNLLIEHKEELQKEFDKDEHGVKIKDAIDVKPNREQ